MIGIYFPFNFGNYNADVQLKPKKIVFIAGCPIVLFAITYFENLMNENNYVGILFNLCIMSNK